jgi:hypothetical protein
MITVCAGERSVAGHPRVTRVHGYTVTLTPPPSTVVSAAIKGLAG